MLLSARDTLLYYREESPIILETDAIDLRGDGGRLVQCCYMTTWRAPSVCLKNLLDHEKNYSVIDKEALDCITLVLQGSISMCMATNSPHVQITSHWNTS